MWPRRESHEAKDCSAVGLGGRQASDGRREPQSAKPRALSTHSGMSNAEVS